MPLLIGALLIGVIRFVILGFFDFLVRKVGWAGLKFFIFMAFWVSLYLTIIVSTTNWIQSLLTNQAVFGDEAWLMGISLLPANSSFCMMTTSLAYTLFWILSFKRQMTAKYKDSTDGK